LRLATGRLPSDGRPEVALHADIARNRHLKLGDVVLEPSSEDSFSAEPMRLVGTFEGRVWLAMTSEAFIRDHFPLAPQGEIVIARTPADQRALDRILDRKLDKSR